MAVNVVGLIVMIFFYLLVLCTGIWASFKSRQKQRECAATEMDMALLGNRGINWLVGIFTMTGEAGAHDTGPDRTGPDRTGLDHTVPDHTRPDHTAPDHTVPDYTGQHHTGPDHTGPDYTRPDYTRPSQWSKTKPPPV